MAAPKGNKHALGSTTNGRKKVFTPEVIEALSLELESWSKRDSSDYIGDFCLEHNLHPQRISDFSKANVVFEESLKIAKLRIASRIRKLLHKNSYNYGLFMKEIGMYDHFYLEHERDQLTFEYNLKKEEKNNIPQEIKYIVQYAGNSGEVHAKIVPTSDTKSA